MAVAGALPGISSGAIASFSASFENGTCSQFTQGCKISGSGSYSIPTGGAYSGSRYLRATVAAGGGVSFARAQQVLSIPLGQDFWFGAAIRLKAGFYGSGGQVRLFAWDTYPSSPTERSGLWVDSTGRVVVYRHVDGREQTPLVVLGTRAIGEERWVKVDIHQRLSMTDGQAITEVYVDGSLVGRSTMRNTAGATVTRYRVGITDASLSSRSLTVDSDRAYIGPSRL